MMKKKVLIAFSIVAGLIFSLIGPATLVQAVQLSGPNQDSPGGYFGTYHDVYRTNTPGGIEGATPVPFDGYSTAQKVATFQGIQCLKSLEAIPIRNCNFSYSLSGDQYPYGAIIYIQAVYRSIGGGYAGQYTMNKFTNVSPSQMSSFKVDMAGIPNAFKGTNVDTQGFIDYYHNNSKTFVGIGANISFALPFMLPETKEDGSIRYMPIGGTVPADTDNYLYDYYNGNGFDELPVANIDAQLQFINVLAFPRDIAPGYLSAQPYTFEWSPKYQFPPYADACVSSQSDGLYMRNTLPESQYQGNTRAKAASATGLFSWSREENTCFQVNGERFKNLTDDPPIIDLPDPDPDPDPDPEPTDPPTPEPTDPPTPEPTPFDPPQVNPPQNPNDPDYDGPPIPDTPGPPSDTPGAGGNPEECSFGDMACYVGSLFMPSKDIGSEVGKTVGNSKAGGLLGQLSTTVNSIYSSNACSDISMPFRPDFVINFDPCVEQVAAWLRPLTTAIGWLTIVILLVTWIWKLIEPRFD